MKKTIFLILLIALPTVTAYIKPQHYNNIIIKNYSERDISWNFEILQRIPSNYTKGLISISFFDNYWSCNTNAGLYFYDWKQIRICDYSEETLMHELTHHLNNIKRIKANHGEQFKADLELLESYS